MRIAMARNAQVDVAIFAVTMMILATGIMIVYSASGSLSGYEQRMEMQKRGFSVDDMAYHDSGYLMKQLGSAGIGLIALFFFYNFDYRHLKKWSFLIMGTCFVLLCLVWVPGIGVESNGARRWIRGLGQPSEFAKLGLIIYMAKMLDDRHRFIKSFFGGVMPAMVVGGAFALIIVLEPDFGGAFTLCAIVFGMWICGEMRWFHLFGLTFAGVPAMVAAFILEPYRIRRLFAFISDNPEIQMREGFQLNQSLIAAGSGGWFGAGLGNSMQKYHYLNAAHTDFIFAIVAEELGFIRCSLLVMMFMVLVLLGWWVALNTSDLFGSLLATGITLMIFMSASINMCVVLGLLPTKGLVLPFISYGRSNLLMTLAAIGILMNIARRQFALSGRAPAMVEMPM